MTKVERKRTYQFCQGEKLISLSCSGESIVVGSLNDFELLLGINFEVYESSN